MMMMMMMMMNWHLFRFMIFLSTPYCTMVIDDVMFLVYLVGMRMATVTTSVAVV